MRLWSYKTLLVWVIAIVDGESGQASPKTYFRVLVVCGADSGKPGQINNGFTSNITYYIYIYITVGLSDIHNWNTNLIPFAVDFDI